ncbi:MAG: DUF4118 domain-containing protein [Actinobacteria bacterium]|nr:DUF4118 domain-containing protein [Actinomycetota bacterium]MBV8561688.1 DUF4118 domain-containing protein [Actinomycetota bacterium]
MRRFALGIGSCALAVTAITALIELLKGHIPVLSLAVLYLLGVIPIAVFFGLAYGVLVAVASMLAFNFFFLPPLYTFTLQDSRNWFALLVFVVTAVVVSQLATRSRRQAQEAELLARVATALLEQNSAATELDRIEAATATPGSRRRLLPALTSLQRIAAERERLAGEALEAEAYRRSDAMKTALLRAVSHDLRSPLMAILTSAGALAHAELALEPGDRQELADTILGEAERLDRLVSNLLDLSRLQAGAAAPELGDWAIEDVVLQAVDGVEGADRVDVVLPDDDSPLVHADLHQAERVVANLVENALRYSPPDEKVRVQVRRTGRDVLVRVVDHGPGIPPTEAERIFEPFQRGSLTGETRGAGLGLAIARGFAEANGGRVWVESHAGQGATFVLALPVAAQAHAEVPA